MAGRPILDKLCAQIERAGGDHVVFDRFADGEPVRDIMQSFGVSRTMFYAWITRGGPERDKVYTESKRLRAHALAEDAGEQLDNARPLLPVEASIVKERANHKRWLAGKLNRDEYGDAPQVQINNQLNVGDLHLDALRAAGGPRALPIPSAEFEVLP
jgi:hypothetical protein